MWGGLATEAATAVRDLAVGELGLRRLVSLIRPTNVASWRVAEKIGMRKDRQITREDTVYWIYALSKRKA
ncbi:MAG: GNAT family N-acetyltransferase [Candidatus Eisenbacteria bacterium]